MNNFPKCPNCNSEYTYEDGSMYVCPECAHEWNKAAVKENTDEKRVVRDASGNVLNDGDSITVIKNLRVKGSSSDLASVVCSPRQMTSNIISSAPGSGRKKYLLALP
jgi:protein PhnA